MFTLFVYHHSATVGEPSGSSLRDQVLIIEEDGRKHNKRDHRVLEGDDDGRPPQKRQCHDANAKVYISDVMSMWTIFL